MKVIEANSKRVFNKFLVVLVVLLSFNPYLLLIQHASFLNAFSGYLLQLFYVFLFLVLLSMRGRGIMKLPGIIVNCIGLQIIGYLLSFIVHGGIGYFLVFITMALMVLLFSYIEYNIGFIRFFGLYNKWILIMAFGGVGIFILGQILGIPPIYQEKSVISESSTISSWLIGYTNCYFADSPLSFIRYSGYFDEPGAMGYWGIYALVINKIFVKNNRLEWLLLLSLMITFSFGYYIQAFVYIVLFYGFSRLRKNSIWIALLVIIALVWIYSTKGTQNDQVYEATFGRLEKVELIGGELTMEDHRTELTEIAKKTFRENPLFGVGIVEWSKLPYMSDNPYETLAKDGLFGTFYLYLPMLVLLILAIKRNDKDLVKGVIVISLGFLHRPFHENLLAYFMMYSFLYLAIKSPILSKQHEAISLSYNSRL